MSFQKRVHPIYQRDVCKYFGTKKGVSSQKSRFWQICCFVSKIRAIQLGPSDNVRGHMMILVLETSFLDPLEPFLNIFFDTTFGNFFRRAHIGGTHFSPKKGVKNRPLMTVWKKIQRKEKNNMAYKSFTRVLQSAFDLILKLNLTTFSNLRICMEIYKKWSICPFALKPIWILLLDLCCFANFRFIWC